MDSIPPALSNMGLNPRKPVFWGFRPSFTQTSLLSYRDYLESCNFAGKKLRYDTCHYANDKGADHTVLMRRPFCACVVRKPEYRFSHFERPKYDL